MNVNEKTTYEEVCLNYSLLSSEKDDDFVLLLKSSEAPPIPIHAAIFCPAHYHYVLWLREQDRAVCWFSCNGVETLLFEGNYNEQMIMDSIVSHAKQYSFNDAKSIEFAIYPDCFQMYINKQICLLYKFYALFKSRVIFIHIKSFLKD